MEILRSLYQNRLLVAELVRRDLRSRYMGSALGVFWSVLNPLVTLAIYTVVFSGVLRVKLGPDDGIYSFVEYLFCGLLPWITIQESISRSASCVLENANLVQKMRFPTEILPVNLALSGAVHQWIGTGIFFVILGVAGDLHYRWLVVLPVLFLLQLMATVGLCWVIASVNVYFRDAVQVLGILLTVWFWMTPIVYRQDTAPKFFSAILRMNPWTHLVQIYRAVILEGNLGTAYSWGFLTGFAAVSFVLGLAVIRRYKSEFADLI